VAEHVLGVAVVPAGGGLGLRGLAVSAGDLAGVRGRGRGRGHRGAQARRHHLPERGSAWLDLRRLRSPAKAIPTSTGKAVANLVRASGNREEAEYEVNLWSDKTELFECRNLANAMDW
jgi:hypothetical protein